MTIEILEGLDPLIPLDFFALKGQLPHVKENASSRWMQKNALLPELSEELIQENFAQIAMGWNETCLLIDLVVDKPFEEASYPNFREGDSFELFIDTRDLKTTRFMTSFCHHFVFLPQAVQGVRAQEITHFRTEDKHPLCSGDDLQVEASFHKNSYEMRLMIPSFALQGFDPSSFDRLGLSYRLNRFKGPPQLFSASAEHFLLEQQPKIWASFLLTK